MKKLRLREVRPLVRCHKGRNSRVIIFWSPQDLSGRLSLPPAGLSYISLTCPLQEGLLIALSSLFLVEERERKKKAEHSRKLLPCPLKPTLSFQSSIDHLLLLMPQRASSSLHTWHLFSYTLYILHSFSVFLSHPKSISVPHYISPHLLWRWTRSDHGRVSGGSFFKKKIYYLIYLNAPGLSCGMWNLLVAAQENLVAAYGI